VDRYVPMPTSFDPLNLTDDMQSQYLQSMNDFLKPLIESVLEDREHDHIDESIDKTRHDEHVTRCPKCAKECPKKKINATFVKYLGSNILLRYITKHVRPLELKRTCQIGLMIKHLNSILMFRGSNNKTNRK
jgi:hypothetical protein